MKTKNTGLGTKLKVMDFYIKKGPSGLETASVFLVDKEGRLLDSAALCLIYEKRHPWFYEWLKKKFEEDKGE